MAWLLFFHLPAKDKQLKEFIDSKDAHVLTLTTKYENKITTVTDTFRHDSDAKRVANEKALAAILDHCKEEANGTRETFKTEIQRLVESRIQEVKEAVARGRKERNHGGE